MKPKTLLLASAIAFAATSAYAADIAVVPEPEPVGYVRVCDAYGMGFFYIPGTETCVRVSGYIWYQIGATTDDGLVTDAEGNVIGGDTPNYQGFLSGGWNKSTRPRVNIDARSETEWGQLRAFVRFQADWGNELPGAFADGPVSTDQAWLSLGGLRLGYTESAWAKTTFHVTNGGSFSDGQLWYGDQERHLIQYNFGGDKGLFGVVSLEDDALEGRGFVPDAVGLIGYQAEWGAVWARLAYDESYNEYDDSGFGAELGAQVNLTRIGGEIRLMGWYADADHMYGTQSSYAGISGGSGNAEWSVLAAYNQVFTRKFSASTGFQYFNDFYEALSDVKTGLNGYSADLSFVWLPVDDFEVRAEANYDKVDTFDGSVAAFLRFTRFF